MKKLNIVVLLTAVLLVAAALVFKFTAPTGAAVGPIAGVGGNMVTVIAIIAIAGIVVVTLYKKF